MKLYTLAPGPRWAFMLVHEEGDAHNVDVIYRTSRSASGQLVGYNLDTSEPEFHAGDAPMVPPPPPRERIDINIPHNCKQFNAYLMGFCRNMLRTTERVQDEGGIAQVSCAWIRYISNGYYAQRRGDDDLLNILLVQHRDMFVSPAPPEPREGLSSGCLLHPAVALSIMFAGREHPCDRCNHDRSVCRGFPPRTPDPLSDYCL